MTSTEVPRSEGKELLGYKDVARRLGVPVGTVHALVSQQRIPFVRFGRRFVRFDAAEIDRWVEARKVAPK